MEKNKMKLIRRRPPLFPQNFRVIKNINKGQQKKAHPPFKKQPNKGKNELIANYRNENLATSAFKSNFRLNNNSTVSMNQRKKYEYCKNILSFTDYELNYMVYDEALKNDRRSYCSYYLSLLRIKHLLIFSFCPMNDYNSRVIKVVLFFINFAVFFTVNALFFNDSTMHKIYQDGGSFDFIYQLPKIIYSSLISTGINIFLKSMALTGTDIIEIKQCKDDDIEETKNKVKERIKCKITSFFLISSLLLILFCYYIGCFCAVYRNTQMHLIKDSIISFGLSFIYQTCSYENRKW